MTKILQFHLLKKELTIFSYGQEFQFILGDHKQFVSYCWARMQPSICSSTHFFVSRVWISWNSFIVNYDPDRIRALSPGLKYRFEDCYPSDFTLNLAM